MTLKKLINKNNFILICVTLYIFFWDVAQTLRLNFDPRLIIFALSLFLIIEIVKDIKNKNYLFFYIGTLILLFLVAHSYLVGNLLNIKFFLSIFFLIYLFGIAYYFHDIILDNKKTIIYLFISLFLVSIFIHFFIIISTNPEPFSCGAVKNLFKEKNNFNSPLFLIHFLSSYSLIFNENSHLAMSGISVIIYSIFLITKSKNNKSIIFFLCMFIVICFLKSSATLLAGTTISIITLLVIEYKRLNKYFIICALILISIIAIIFSQDSVCLNKIVLDQKQVLELKKINPLSKEKKIDKEILIILENLENIKKTTLVATTKIENIDKDTLINISNIKITEDILITETTTDKIKLEDKETKIEDKSIKLEDKSIKLEDKSIKLEDEKIKLENERVKLELERIKLEKKLLLLKKEKVVASEAYEVQAKVFKIMYPGSLSSEVFFHALKVSYTSFIKKPFGHGFQGYEIAFNNYNKANNIYRKSLEVYNSKDASNTFFKSVTEFGVFSIALYLLLLTIFFNKKVNLGNKVFLIPFIVTQSIRGAGYFNGGYLLILFLLIIIYYKKLR